MTQIPLEKAREDVVSKLMTERSHLRELPQWLQERDTDSYRKRKQTHEAWDEICNRTIEWINGLMETQNSISERKFLNRKREDLRAVIENGEYPYADLPEPKPPIN